MTRAVFAGLAAALLVLASCGRYGPPTRASDTAPKKAAPGNNPNEPNAPAPEPPPPVPDLEP